MGERAGMSRLSTFIAIVLAAALGAVGATYLSPARNAVDAAQVRAIIAEERPAPAPGLDRTAIEAIVTEALATRPAPAQSVAKLDAATLNPMIESYLLDNPRILQRVSVALQAELTRAKAEQTRTALTELKSVIYTDPKAIVVGNPNGDVTLVEMFDYNCGYCRQALPDLAALLDEDPNLRIVLKEYPILSAESVEAARVGVLVGQSKVDYWAFHQALFTSRGKVDKAAALKAASDLGLNPLTLEMDMNSATVDSTLQVSFDMAQKLGISGTPTFILGDEVIPGAIGLDNMRMRIANMRACGATFCPDAKATATDQPG